MRWPCSSGRGGADLPTSLPAWNPRSFRLPSGSSLDRLAMIVPGRQRVCRQLSRWTGGALSPLKGPVVSDAIGWELSALSCALSCVHLAESVRRRREAQGLAAPWSTVFWACIEGHGLWGDGERALPVLQSSVQRIFSYVFNELGKRAPEEVPGDVGAAQQAPV